MSLRIGADGFALPLDVVTEAVGIVATRGAGKTYTSVTLIEEAHESGVPAVVIDPTGVYHGLRSASSGKGDGLPFYVFGGPHGDLPLEASAGGLIADVVVDSGNSFVLDVSDFSKTKARAFVADFLERLYERKARQRTTLLVVLDEADEWAPQRIGKLSPDSARCLGAVETLAKRGRSRGLGVVMISQRTQAINKDVLDLIETMFAMRISAPRSRATVKEWLDVKEADDDLGVLSSLSGLPTGEAWIWSPVRGLLERVKVRRIRTFDSYSTPKPGEVRAEPSRRAVLDLDALGEQMRSTVERQRDNDPGELRRRIRELEARGPEREVEVVREEVRVEVPVLTHADRGELARIGDALDAIEEQLAPLARSVQELRDRVTTQAAVPAFPPKPASPPPASPIVRLPPERSPAPDGNGRPLKAGARRILEALAAHHPMVMTRSQVAVHAGLKRSGGTFGSYWSTCKTSGYLSESPAGASLTEAGLDLVGGAQVAATPDELLAMWRGRLKAGARKMLDELVAVHPHALSRGDLALRAGIEPSGGTFGSYLSTLKRAELVIVDGQEVRANDHLFSGVR